MHEYLGRLSSGAGSADGSLRGGLRASARQPGCNDEEAIVTLRARLQHYCFEGAKVTLIVSVPGRFQSDDTRFGHLALRAQLRDVRGVEAGTTVAQFSSMARMDCA